MKRTVDEKLQYNQRQKTAFSTVTAWRSGLQAIPEGDEGKSAIYRAI